MGQRRVKLEAIDDDEEEAIIVEGKLVLFSESMVSGGSIDGGEMGELEAARWGFQGKGTQRNWKQRKKCYSALEVIRFTDIPHNFTED